MWKRATSAMPRMLAQGGQSLICDTDAEFRQARTRAFVALWQSVIPSGRHIPTRNDLTPHLLRDYLPYLIVIDMDAGRQRYRFRLVGTEVTAMNGRDATGKWLDELYGPADMAVHHQVHQSLIATGRPVRIHGTLAFVDRSFITMEAAAVPLAVDTPDHIEQFMICLAYGEIQPPAAEAGEGG